MYRLPKRGLRAVMRILVLGAGFGGLELAATLSEQFGAALDPTLPTPSTTATASAISSAAMTWWRRVDVTFRSGQSPVGTIAGLSADLVADKAAFGRTRIARWFG
jgi:hypothetical protein